MENKIEIVQNGFYVEVFCKNENETIGYMNGYAGDDFIHLIDGKIEEGYKRQGTMTRMIKTLQRKFPKAELSFHTLSCNGLKFTVKAFPNAIIHPRKAPGVYERITIKEYYDRFGDQFEDSDCA